MSGERLKEAIQKSGKTRAEIADDLQESIYQLSRWVNNRRRPAKRTRSAINKYFGKEIYHG